jgi:hypothetical protein
MMLCMNTDTAIRSGTAVRFFSMCGPCIPATVRKVNRVTVEMALYGKIEKYLVHTKPCPSCTDHPRTQYRDGYMD